jgi:hypothetical protein
VSCRGSWDDEICEKICDAICFRCQSGVIHTANDGLRLQYLFRALDSKHI